MKHRFILQILSLAAPILLAACVPSVNPLYTADTIAFRPELLGAWKEKPESEDSWTFTKSGENAYTVVIQDKESSSTFAGHLVKLDDTLYLDLFPTEDVLEKAKVGGMYRVALIPGHLFAKIKLGKTLEIQMLNPDGFKEFLSANPKAIAHAVPEPDRFVITAPTDELQKFFKKHAETRSLWGDPGVLQKVQL